jgi:Ribbon-helix-helix domain
VKTTLDIQDALLQRAKLLSKRTGKPLRALVEEGLSRVLAEHNVKTKRYQLPDCSVGDASATNPLESWSWQDLRDEIYGGRTAV